LGPVFPVWAADQPAARVRVADTGLLSLTLFGVEREIPDPSLARRDQMGRLLDWVGSLVGQPFQAEIIEADGSASSGWVNPRPGSAVAVPDPPTPPWKTVPTPTPGLGAVPTRRADLTPGLVGGPGPAGPGGAAAQAGAAPPPGSAARARHASAKADAPVAAGGFQPGEEVVLAFVATAVAADPDGTARLVAPSAVLDLLPTGEVVLFGRVSGTIAVLQPR
jgi:hypothetical protein